MGWWIFGRKSSGDGPIASSQTDSKKQEFLEDLPPKFDDSNQQIHQQKLQQLEQNDAKNVGLRDAWATIKLSDFTMERMTSIPCFREGFITGFSALGVLSTVILLTSKNPTKAANWGVGGFLLGSTIGWEQCRSARRKSFEQVELAKQVQLRRIQMKKDQNLKENDSES